MFARLADGNAKRLRAIEGQETLLGRTMHGIEYDAIHDEVMVPQQFGQSILVFRGGAGGEEKPLRVIQGRKTQLISPDRLAIDAVHSEIYVPEGEKVLVFPRDASGDTAPVRVLTGPDTGIGSARAVAVDNLRDLLVVASSPPGKKQVYQISMFDRRASGNTKPKRVITGLTGYGNMTLYAPRGLIFMVLPPRIGTGFTKTTDDIGYVGVYSVDDEGPARPRYTIGGPSGVLVEPRGVVLDPKNKSVIVSDKQLNAILTFEAPMIFDTPVGSPRQTGTGQR